MTRMKFKYLIIGAGPAGLGVAYCLNKKGIKDWLILEKENYAGGLSASFKDKKGFYWDLGGHVLFGSNKEFVNVVKKILGKNLKKYQRRAAIFFGNKFIPYPFQDNIHLLDLKRPDLASLQGLTLNNLNNPKNFQDWLYSTFGRTLSESFFIPQNQKSWAYPLNKMSFSWIKKRIKIVNLQTSRAALAETAGKGWGGNSQFYYPKTGGIGILWQTIAKRFKDKIIYRNEVIKIDHKKKLVYLQNGQALGYQYLISTMPLDLLMKTFSRQKVGLKHNSGLVIGLGIKGELNNSYHWVYYPEKDYTFFRLVFPSNFSRAKKGECSIISEISLPMDKKINIQTNNILAQIKKLNLFKGEVISVFRKSIKYFYPIPTLDRDLVLVKINKFINKKNIFSFGRFGGWKYEKGNMDDAFMKGSNLPLDTIPHFM